MKNTFTLFAFMFRIIKVWSDYRFYNFSYIGQEYEEIKENLEINESQKQLIITRKHLVFFKLIF